MNKENRERERGEWGGERRGWLRRRRNRTAYGPRTVQTEAPAGTVGILGNGGPHSIIPSYYVQTFAGQAPSSRHQCFASQLFDSSPPSIAHNQHMPSVFAHPSPPLNRPPAYCTGLDPAVPCRTLPYPTLASHASTRRNAALRWTFKDLQPCNPSIKSRPFPPSALTHPIHLLPNPDESHPV